MDFICNMQKKAVQQVIKVILRIIKKTKQKMLFLVKEEDKVKNQHKYTNISKNQFPMVIIYKYLEEEIIFEIDGSQLEISYDKLLYAVKNIFNSEFRS